VIDSRIRSRRSGAILAAALFIIATMPGLATAANSRSLFIGAPDAVTNDGKLFPTTVSKPGQGAPDNATKFVVQIKSTDNQNLAHTVLTIDANFQGTDGLTFNTIYDPNQVGDDDATFCGHVGTLITCDYGSLTPAIGSRTVAVVVNVTDGYVAPANQPLFWAKVTTNNENGSNQQVFIAASGPTDGVITPPPPFNVSAFNPNLLTSFAAPGQVKHLFTSSPTVGGTLGTTVDFTGHSAGDEVAIKDGASDPATYPCPAKLTCISEYSEVSIGDGSFSATSYLTWTLVALVPKSYTLSQGFVAHFNTLTNNDWTLFFKNASSYCGTGFPATIAPAQQCIVSKPTLSKPVNGFSTLTVIVAMNHQGGMKA
jgi:hypothetical protein